MIKITLEVPDNTLPLLHCSDASAFSRELRIAAAVKWYELRKLDDLQAAAIAGLSQAEFSAALERHGVSSYRGLAERLVDESSSA